MKKLMNRKGYVSVETIIVAGLLIALGAFVLAGLSRQANNINSDATSQMNVAQTNQNESYKSMVANDTALAAKQTTKFGS